MSLSGVPEAVQEFDNKGIPQLVAALDAALTRAEKLIDRLDGATITVTIKLGEPK